VRITVLVKEVPDTYGDRRIDPATGLAVRDPADAVLDEVCERALETALRVKDAAPDTEVVAMTMGPESAVGSLRRALAIGADSAVLVSDSRLAGADLTVTATVIAAALRKVGFDLVVAGNQSTDGTGAVIVPMLAELLGIPGAGHFTTIDVSSGRVAGTRATDGGSVSAVADLPAIVSVTEQAPEARFPSLKSTMGAKRKPIEIWSLDDLSEAIDDPAVARSIVLAVSERPPRTQGVVVTDTGDAAEQLADFLIANRLV